MSRRLPVPTAPGPLESYASSFDDLFNKRNQRDTFRRYLEGLLLPSERNKTLTGLANTEPVAGATHKDAQKLQWFLSESTWDPALVNNKRLALLSEDEHSKPNPEGALVIDETGDRKWGRHTAHVGRQYLGSIGKIDNGVVSVHTLWANEERYYPIEVEPYTPAPWFALGKNDPEFRSKPQIALELIENAHALGIPFRAVVADRFYGENHPFWTTLQSEEIPYVLALNPSHAWWHQIGTIGSAEGVAGAASWREDDAGVWEKLTRCFRDGHQETWWALEGVAGPYGPESAKRLIIVTTDPAALPEESTFYLRTNLPAPGSSRAQESGMIPADVAEIVRLYGLRVWVRELGVVLTKSEPGCRRVGLNLDLVVGRSSFAHQRVYADHAVIDLADTAEVLAADMGGVLGPTFDRRSHRSPGRPRGWACCARPRRAAPVVCCSPRRGPRRIRSGC